MPHFILIVEYKDVQLGTLVDVFGPYSDIYSVRDAQKQVQKVIDSKIEKAETDGFRVSSRNRPVANIRVMNKPEEEVINHEIREMMRFLPYTTKG